MTNDADASASGPGLCPACRKSLDGLPALVTRDAPCPRCGQLLWFPPAGAPLRASSLQLPLSDIDEGNSGELAWRLQRAMEGAQILIVDFSKVKFISSEGLAALLAAKRRLKDAGGDLYLRNTLPFVRDTLTVMNLADEFAEPAET